MEDADEAKAESELYGDVEKLAETTNSNHILVKL